MNKIFFKGKWKKTDQLKEIVFQLMHLVSPVKRTGQVDLDDDEFRMEMDDSDGIIMNHE